MLNSRDKLYSALSGQFDLGSQEEFDSKMNSPQSRRKLYDAVSAKVDLGSYDEFESKVSPVKKKESSVSTSTAQNGSGASVQKDGFSDSQKASLDNFKVNSTDLQNVSIGNKPKTLDVLKEADLTMRKVQLEKQIATKPQDRKDFKQNPKYASAKEELHDVNSKLQQVKEVENQKNAQLDSSIENAIFTVDDNKIKSAIDSEVNDNEISDYAREGGKNVLNVLGGIANIAPKTINALSGGKLDLPTYEPFEKKIPFEKATKQVNDEIKEAKKKDPNLEVTPEEFNKRVKDVFVEQQKQNQYQENASKLLADADPQVQERIKGKYINEIGNLDKSAKANSVQIQVLDNKATPLRKELLETKQLIDAGKADPTTIADFNSKLENYNQMEQQYAKLVSEQEKNSNKKLTAEDRLKLFKLDYNPYSKAIDDLTAPTAKMLGEGVYALGKASDAISELPIIGDDRKAKGEKSALTEAGDSLIKSAEEVTARHQNNKFSDIDGFGKFGSWATQTVGTVAPYVLGSGIGTTEEQALSKAFLTPSKALGGFSVASAGGAMNEMDSEMANNPVVKYNNWQYAGKVLGSVGSNAIMFGNYGNMLKGNKALFESISKTPEANVEFQKGVKDYLDSALKVGKGMNKSGAIMMGSQAINMFVDNHILGKKHEDGFDELANAYIEGSAMHGLISEVPNLASFMIEKVLPNGAKKEINQNLKKGYGLAKELENPDLTPDEKSVIQNQIDAVHKDNERLLKASNKVVEGFTHNQVKELLKIDQDKFAITKDVEDIKNGNYSKEYKQNALNEKKAEFNALETRRQDVFENEHNALTLLSKSEQNRLEKEAKTRIAEKEGKEIADVKFEPKEVNDTALRIHKTELKEQAVKDAEAKIPTSETKSKAEVPQQAEAEKVAEFPLKEGETLVETKQDNKGRTFNTVAITTEKEGLKKTKFLFNRSDKPSDQRNLSSISPEKLSSDFGFEISKDDVPEGFEVTRVKEIRETDKGSAATVTIKDTESDESWDAEIVITKTKETPKPQEVSPVEDVVATSISKEEYADFVDNNNVSDERLNSISEKVKNQEKLSEQENAIFVGKTSEINKIIATKAGSVGVGGDVDFTAKGGNKVVDEKGEPITVYHTTKVKNISEFKTSGEIETLGGKVKNEGAYFTPIKGEYENKGGNEYAVQISIKNPYITTDQIESAIISPEKKADLISKGHDGVILMRNGKPAEYVVFDKSQIKSVEQPTKETTKAETTTNVGVEEGSGGVGGDVEATAKALEEVAKKKPNASITFINKQGYEQKVNLNDTYEFTQPEEAGLKGETIKGFRNQNNTGIIPFSEVAEAYHKAKKDGSNPELVEAVEKLLKNEATPTNTTPTDGNVQSRTSDVGESGTTKQESPTKENLPSSVDGGESKTDVPKKEIGAEPEEVVTDKDGNEYTSLKRSIADAEREAEGKDAKFTPTGKSAEKRQQETFDKIKSGEITEQEITDLTTALATGEMENFYTKLSPEQQEHVLLYNKVKLKNEAVEINKEIEANADNPQKQAEAILKKAQNEILTEENYDASVRLKGEWGRQGQAMQLAIANDYSNEGILHKLKVASVDKEIPKATREIVAKMAKDIEDLQVKLDESQKKIDAHDEEVKKLLDEKSVLEEKISKTKGEEKLEKLKALKDTKEVKKATIEKKKLDTINSIKAKYKKLSGNVSSGGNLKLLELAPDITALAKLHVQEGVVELEELIGKMLVELQDAIPDLTERDLRDVFSGYGKTVKPSTDENARTLSELKSKARALSGLEDVKDLGIAPLKSGVTHRPPTEEVLELRREIKREMREQGIDITKEKDPEDVWKTALESYKTKIKNRIEYLENIEKTKDIEKFLKDKKKTKLKLDDEARELKKQQQKIKNKVDDIATKADFETWSKYRKALHYSGRYAKGVLISSPVTLVKILGSVGWRVAYKPLHASSMYGMSKIFPKLAETQGINSRKDLADHLVEYYSTAFSKKNIDKFIDTFKNHASEEDILFGKHYSNVPIPKIKGNDKLNIIQKGFFAHLKFLEDINASSHGAMKNLVALPEYTAWKQTILRNLIKEGIPKELLDNGNADQIAHQLAFLKGQRARFMQKNMVAEQQTALEARLRNKGLHGTAEAINFILPIVKIGSNFVGESLEKQPAIGLVPNGANLLKARESLTEKQKSDLLRTLSYQGVGMASFLAGAMLYQNISPFYGTSAQKHAKKDGKDLPEEDESLGFLKGAYTHAPDAVNMRAGATFMWYWDKLDKMNGTQGEKNSMMNFMGAMFNREILGGIVSQSPYISASESSIEPLINSQSDLGKAGANFIRSRVPFGDFTKTLAQGELPIANKLFPETGRELAKKVGLRPEEVKPSDIKLYPKGLKDNLLIGLPNWRKEVLKKLYDDKYGAGKVKTDINSEIDKLLHEGETEQKKQKFLEGIEK